MAKHLVTGSAGFVGSHLARTLINNNQVVHGLDNLVGGYLENIKDIEDNPNFSFIQDDIRNFKTKEEYDYIWHLAARGELYFCRNNPKEAVDINVNGTLNILNIAVNNGVQHMFFADTSAEYDNVEDNYPTKENICPNHKSPLGLYAITKMAASQFVRTYGIKNNFGTTLFRYTNIYGSSMNLNRDIPPVIGSFAKSLINNEQCYIYGDGTKRRDFLYIEDLNKFHMCAFNNRKNKKDTQTFNAGSGINYSIREIYDKVYDAVSLLEDNISNREDVIYKDDQPDEAYITMVDIIKANYLLGWKPTVSVDDGIRLTIDNIL